jgi:hypothetical protein
MLLPADSALIAADPRFTALPLLLDSGALARRLARSMQVSTVQRQYLRYKAGTSCVLSVEIDGRPLVITAYAPGAAVKLRKAERHAGGAAVLAVDHHAGIVVSTPAGDRDLPALADLDRPDTAREVLHGLLRPHYGDAGVALPGLTLRPVSYKPQRRWVGIADLEDDRAFVVRAYRRGAVHDCARATIAAEMGPPRTPAVLGVDRRRSLMALEYLTGRILPAQADPVDLAAAGAALGALHCRPPDQGAASADPLGVAAARSAGRSLAGLLPDLTDRIRAVTVDLVTALQQSAGPQVRAHGDFSLDQVVIGPNGSAALIDLDRAGPGQAAGDLGCAAAAAAADSLAQQAAALASAAVEHPGANPYAGELHPGDLDLPTALSRALATVDGLSAGYSDQRSLPRGREITAQLAAHLLRRAVEPFRYCRPFWPAQAELLLAAAGELLAADRPVRRRAS